MDMSVFTNIWTNVESSSSVTVMTDSVVPCSKKPLNTSSVKQLTYSQPPIIPHTTADSSSTASIQYIMPTERAGSIISKESVDNCVEQAMSSWQYSLYFRINNQIDCLSNVLRNKHSTVIVTLFTEEPSLIFVEWLLNIFTLSKLEVWKLFAYQKTLGYFIVIITLPYCDGDYQP